MDVKGTLMADNTILVSVNDGGKADQMRFRDIRQMKEQSELLAAEVKRIEKLVPVPKPRYIEKSMF